MPYICFQVLFSYWNIRTIYCHWVTSKIGLLTSPKKVLYIVKVKKQKSHNWDFGFWWYVVLRFIFCGKNWSRKLKFNKNRQIFCLRKPCLDLSVCLPNADHCNWHIYIWLWMFTASTAVLKFSLKLKICKFRTLPFLPFARNFIPVQQILPTSQ